MSGGRVGSGLNDWMQARPKTGLASSKGLAKKKMTSAHKKFGTPSLSTYTLDILSPPHSFHSTPSTPFAPSTPHSHIPSSQRQREEAHPFLAPVRCAP